MVEYETDLKGNYLVREEELSIVYEGPSFEGMMEISNLSNQLKSTEVVIRELVSEIYKQKGLKNPQDVSIYLKLKRGSFHETITIFFNNPIVANIVSGCVVALFTYFITKKKDKPDCKINTDTLINNYYFVKNMVQIVSPLEDEQDRISVISSNPQIKTTMGKEEKKILNIELKELKENVAVELFEEDFFGYLSIVDIDREKYGFTLEGTNQHVPLSFDNKPSLEEIRKILGYRIKITARATYEEKDLKRLEVKDYALKRRKNLKDFGSTTKNE